MMWESRGSWVARELRHVDLGDKRLNRRLVTLVEALAAKPTDSVPEACGSWAATKGAYRFWDSSRVNPDAIEQGHIRSTLERLERCERVLSIQDTTSLDFTHHRATKGLGHLDHPARQGLKVHSVLLATTQGLPLGLIHQQVWTRDPETKGKKHQRQRLETKDKESQRWLTALDATQELVPPGTKVITVADREADIYDLLATPRRPGSDLLIRATHNRRVDHQARYLWEAMSQSPVRGKLILELQRKGTQPARRATLRIRYESLAIQPPALRKAAGSLSPVPVQVILAEEESPPPMVPPVCWLLFTTLAVTSLQEAIQCLQWYSCRWLIERYHFVLKSGCVLEELQLEEAQRLRRALATYCIVAWRLLWLTYEARQNPDTPCDQVLEVHEWQSLYCTIQKTPVPPARPPNLGQAVRWIAQLGGFLARKGDGDPGAKTIWRGLLRLHDIAETWKLLHPELSVQVHS